MENRRWHYVSAKLGHQGAGKSLPIDIYVWAENALEAFNKYKIMGGIQKSKIPNIRPLEQKECIEMEQKILEDGLSLEEAKRKWYTISSAYRWW